MLGRVEDGDIPLKATYTLAEISTNFTMSDGLSPMNDILLDLHRAQARIDSSLGVPCNVTKLSDNKEHCRMSTRLPAAGEK